MKKVVSTALAVFAITCFSPVVNCNAAGDQGYSLVVGQDLTAPNTNGLKELAFSTQNVDEKNLIARAKRAGRRTGPRDGSGPRRDGSSGTCPYPG